MTRRFLYALLSLVLVVGCEFDNVDVEDSYIELGGETLGDVDLSPYWDWADAWPGAVGSTLERISDGEAVIEGGYEKFMYDYDGDVYALQSTGYYAAPTETIQVEVPVGTNTDNLYCQIGIGHALYEGQSRIRYDDVTLKTKLTVGTNRIMSYFGGHVYIYYNHDEGSIPAEDITLKFHNVIVSPDYVDGVTDERDWLATITPGTDDDGNEIEVLPYAEFRSETVIVTLETQYLQSESTQPGEHMAALNAYASAMLEYGGYMDTLSQQPVRIYMDLQLPDSSTSANAAYYGYKYPIGVQSMSTQSKYMCNTTTVKTGRYNSTTWNNIYYLFVHLYLTGWCDPDSDLDNAIANESYALRSPIQAVTVYHNAYAVGSEPVNISTVDLDGITSDLFDANPPKDIFGDSLLCCDITSYYSWMHCATTGAPMKNVAHGGAALLQLYDETDWGLLGYINNRGRAKGKVNDRTIHVDGYDFWAMCASEYRGKNMLPFFNYWKIPVSGYAGEYCKLFPDLEKDHLNKFGEPCYFYEAVTSVYDIKNYSFEQVRPEDLTHDSEFPNFTYDMYSYNMAVLMDGNASHESRRYYTDSVTSQAADLTGNIIYGDTTYFSDYDVEMGLWLMVDGMLETAYTSESLTASDGPYPNIDGYTLATDWMCMTILFGQDLSLPVNTFEFASTGTYHTTSLCHIEYLSIVDGEEVWQSTYPNEFVLFNDASEKYRFYFMENYNARGFRFVVRPDDTPTSRCASISELNFAFTGSEEDVAALKAIYY